MKRRQLLNTSDNYNGWHPEQDLKTEKENVAFHRIEDLLSSVFVQGHSSKVLFLF